MCNMKQDPRTYVYTQITKGLGVKLTSGKLTVLSLEQKLKNSVEQNTCESSYPKHWGFFVTCSFFNESLHFFFLPLALYHKTKTKPKPRQPTNNGKSYLSSCLPSWLFGNASKSWTQKLNDKMERLSDVQESSLQEWIEKDCKNTWARTYPKRQKGRRKHPPPALALLTQPFNLSKKWLSRSPRPSQQVKKYSRVLAVNEFLCSCIGNVNAILVGVSLFCDLLYLLVLSINFIAHIQSHVL